MVDIIRIIIIIMFSWHQHATCANHIVLLVLTHSIIKSTLSIINNNYYYENLTMRSVAV